MATIKVTDANFSQEVLQSESLVLVDFWAEWCAPCRMMGPVVEELAESYAGKMKVCKLNVDENPQTAARYQVMSIPTLILFKGGEEQDRIIGYQPREQLTGRLSLAL